MNKPECPTRTPDVNAHVYDIKIGVGTTGWKVATCYRHRISQTQIGSNWFLLASGRPASSSKLKRPAQILDNLMAGLNYVVKNLMAGLFDPGRFRLLITVADEGDRESIVAKASSSITEALRITVKQNANRFRSAVVTLPDEHEDKWRPL